jgi:hypothetical protein
MEQGWEMYSIVEETIDYAFKGKQMLNMYQYLKSNKATKKDVQEFIDSDVSREIQLLIMDLEQYLEGGNDDQHKQLREGYGHLGKPEARKIKDYLLSLLQDAWRYEQEKKPGRKRSSK